MDSSHMDNRIRTDSRNRLLEANRLSDNPRASSTNMFVPTVFSVMMMQSLRYVNAA
jgi:hypothetical protein